MHFDKRVRSSTSRTATTLKFNMSRLFQNCKKTNNNNDKF